MAVEGSLVVATGVFQVERLWFPKSVASSYRGCGQGPCNAALRDLGERSMRKGRQAGLWRSVLVLGVERVLLPRPPGLGGGPATTSFLYFSGLTHKHRHPAQATVNTQTHKQRAAGEGLR